LNRSINNITKRIVLFASLVIFLTPFLFSASIEANGVGATLESAKKAALLELTSSISVSVLSEQRIINSEYSFDNKTNSDQLYYDDTKILTRVELFGVQFTDQKFDSKKRLYTITAFINEQNSLMQYLEKLKSIKLNIETIEKRNNSGLSVEANLLNLALLIEYYNQFEAYKNVALTLNKEASIPQLINKNKAGAQLDYNNLLVSDLKAQQLNYNKLNATPLASISNEAIRKQSEIELLETSRKIKERQRELDILNIETRKRQEEILNKVSEDIKRAVKVMVDNSSVIKSINSDNLESPDNFIINLEAKKQAVKKILDQRQFEFEKQSKLIKASFGEKYNNLVAKPYRSGEIANGKPTKLALSKRENDLLKIENDMEWEISSISNQLISQPIFDTNSEVNKYLKDILSDYDILKSKQFTLTQSSIKIGDYDGHNKNWPVAIRFTILNQEFSFDDFLTFEYVTATQIPNLVPTTKQEEKRYEEYLNLVDLFEAYFATATNPLKAKIVYNITQGESPSHYNINIINVAISRTDNDESVFTYNSGSNPDKIQYYNYKPSTDIGESLYLVAMVQATEERGAILAINEKKELMGGLKNNFEFSSRVSLAVNMYQSKMGFKFSYSIFLPALENYLYFGLTMDINSNLVIASSSTLSDYLSNYTLGFLQTVGLVCSIYVSDDLVVKQFASFSYAALSSGRAFLLNAGIRISTAKLKFDLTGQYHLMGTKSGLYSISLGYVFNLV